MSRHPARGPLPRHQRHLAALCMAAVVGVTLVPGASLAGQPGTAQGPLVSAAAHHDVSQPLRDYRPSPARASRRPEPGTLPHPIADRRRGTAAVQRLASTASVPATSTSWDGLGDGFSGPQGTMIVNSVPPDTNGDAGITDYVQIVNTELAVFDKATGAVRYGPVPIHTLWTGFGGLCATDDDGDPTVKWDGVAGRWIVTQFAVTRANGTSVPYLECVAVSTSADPTGSYYRYAFAYSSFPDYPKLGVWPDAYYATFNLFDESNHFQGGLVCAYDRLSMLAGAAASQQCFNTGPVNPAPLPADVDGWWQPPAGSPDYLVSLGATSSTLAFWSFHVDWSRPASSALIGPTQLSVASYALPCGVTGICVPQAGTPTQLDSLGDRLMYRLAYRRFVDHEALVVDHSVAALRGVAVRWYEIRLSNGVPSVDQQGTFAPDSVSRWMGSVAQDQAGDLLVGYSASSSAIHPEIRYTGRLPGDTPGELQAEATIFSGGGSQTSITRWGDYSAMAVDPVDDCTFWYTNEYLPSNGTFNWHTRIASVKFPGCSGPPGVPWAPTAVNATLRIDPASATVGMLVSWALPDYAGGVLGYVVTPYLDGTTPLAPVAVSSGLQSVLVQGLLRNRIYTFRVVATNATGTGVASSASPPLAALPLPKAAPPPASTSILSWAPISDAQANLPAGQAELASGATAMTMVLRHFYPYAAPYTVPWVYGQMGSQAPDPVISDVVSYLQSLSATQYSAGPPLTCAAHQAATAFQADPSVWLGAIRGQIDLGDPVVVQLPTTVGLPEWTSDVSGHYVVVTGYDATGMYYADPAFGKVEHATVSAFNSAWGASDLSIAPYQYVTMSKP